jgi:hypothetical protein
MVRGNRKVLPCPSGSIRGDPWALRMVASDDFASGAHLYHEQRKFAQALVYYRKVIRAARRAIMHGDLRCFVVYWMRLGIKLCLRSATVVMAPPYAGPRVPSDRAVPPPSVHAA